jgi:hypothetical protein
MVDPRTERPLAKLARLLGGVVLTRGHLGHQVLGQLLIADLGDSAMAGAGVAIAAISGRRSLFAEAAVGTLAPVLAVEHYFRRGQRRLERRELLLREREERVAQALRSNAAAAALAATPPPGASDPLPVTDDGGPLAPAHRDALAENALLRARNHALEIHVAELDEQLRVARAAITTSPATGIVEPDADADATATVAKRAKASRPKGSRHGKGGKKP